MNVDSLECWKRRLAVSLVAVLVCAVVPSTGHASSPFGEQVLDLIHPPIERGIIINLPGFQLHLVEESKLTQTYPIAVGRLRTQTADGWIETETPVGAYTVTALIVDPSWYPPAWLKEARGWPTDYVVRSGPDNPLGVRWIGLSLPGYGIHGTNSPESIGGSVSLGCIRMKNEAVTELFSHVRIGDPVWIVHRRAMVYPDPDTSEPTLALYPDLYGSELPTAAALERVLIEQGYPVVTNKLRIAVVEAQETAQAMVLRRPNSLVVNGRTVGQIIVESPDSSGRDGAIYVPVRTAVEALGLQVQAVDESHVTTDTHREIAGQVINGRFVAPWESLIEDLGINGEWYPDNRELHLWGVYVDLFGYAATRDAYIENGMTFVNIDDLANGRLAAYFRMSTDGVAYVLGQQVESVVRRGRTYVSLRTIAERFSARLYWVPEEGVARVSYR